MACTRQEETAESRGVAVILEDKRQLVTVGVHPWVLCTFIFCMVVAFSDRASLCVRSGGA